MNRITWKNNMTEALSEIKGGSRLPMIFFFGQECEGSKKMLNEVLTDEKVAVAIERETAPMMVDVEKGQELARRFKVDWTPAFVICDDEGNELERIEGYLPTEDFIPQLLLSKGLPDLPPLRRGGGIWGGNLLITEAGAPA